MARLSNQAKTLKEKISAKLAGYEQRQAQRSAAREFHNRICRVYRARRDGTLDMHDAAVEWLRQNNYLYSGSIAFKTRTLFLDIGVTLTYGPDGKLSYAKRPRSAGYSYGGDLWS